MSRARRETDTESRVGWRKALGSAGALAAVGLAGCAAEEVPDDGTSEDDESEPDEGFEGDDETPAGADDCEDAVEVDDPEEAHRLTAAEYLLEQVRDGLPADVLDEAEAVGEAARESVAYLELYEDGVSTGHATGWFVEEGVIATNAHNIVYGNDHTDEVRGYTPDGRSFETEIAGYVEGNSPDVAVLTTDFADAPPLPVRRDADLTDGEVLVQVGHPGGFGNWVVCAGRYAGRTFPLPSSGSEDLEFTSLVTSVPGLTGVSGSPVLDLRGEVVAMTDSSVDVHSRAFGDPVAVAPDRVFDAPIASIGTSNHVDIDVVSAFVDRWT